MSLQQTGQYNDLSPKLLDRLTKRIEGYGKTVRYRFDIERENPDKTFYNGKTIFPSMYTLDPTVFNITDKEEDRPGKSKTKKIALIKKYEDKGSHGIEVEFTKIRIGAGRRGILRLELENPDDFAMAMCIELHPKLNGGDFQDSEKHAVVSLIDENAVATVASEERSARLVAMTAAQGMSAKEILDFVDAMQWDSSREEGLMREDVEALAEQDPIFFNTFVQGKNVEFQALVKQALNKGIINFDQAENKFTWSGNKQPITVVSPIGNKSEVEKMAEWLQISGKAGEEVAKKLKSLVAGKEPATV